MLIRFKIFGHRITLSCVPVITLVGANSKLEDGSHILMWDFDDESLQSVSGTLRDIQTRYFLPSIYILQSSVETHWVAYSFTNLPWERAIEIVAATKGVDPNFFKLAVWRGHFTLRVSEKYGEIPVLRYKLTSLFPSFIDTSDIKRWTVYESTDRRSKLSLLLPKT